MTDEDRESLREKLKNPAAIPGRNQALRLLAEVDALRAVGLRQELFDRDVRMVQLREAEERAEKAERERHAARELLRKAHPHIPYTVEACEVADQILALLSDPVAPCGGSRCHLADDGRTLIHSSKSYGTCSTLTGRAK
jgi:hypothetical protein